MLIGSARLARRSRELAVLLIILTVAVAVRTIGITFGLPYVYYPDEAVLVNHAMAFGTGDLNPHYFIYPSLYMYVLFLMYGLSYVGGWVIGIFSSQRHFVRLFFEDATLFYLSGRIVAALSGIACVVVAYALGRRAYGARVGLVAAAILAVSVSHVEFSHYVKTHVPGSLLVLLTVWLAWKIQQGDSRYRRYIAAGAMAGLAASVIYHAGLVLVTVVTAHLLRTPESPASVSKSPFSPRLLAAIAAAAAGFAAGTPYALLDWNTFMSELTATGTMYYRGGVWESSILFPLTSLSDTIGQPLDIIAAGALAYALARRRPQDLLVASQPLFLALFLSVFATKERQHMVVAFGPIALISAVFLTDAVRFLVRSPQRQVPALALLTLVLVAAPAGQAVFNTYRLTLPDTRTVAKAWVEEHVDYGSTVLMDSGKYYLSALGPPLPVTRKTIEDFIVRGEALAGQPLARREGTRRIGYSAESRFFREQLEALGDRSGYNVIQILHDDASPRADILTLDQYKALGVEYAIVSSYGWRAYMDGGEVTLRHPDKALRYRSLYDDLRTRATLLKEFTPADGFIGPTLRVYKLS